ncbi:dihydrolipoamide acetyltransferase family protein [Pontibacter sp. G13]|uniref:dihydrolipoamide acetyltransferase family protein n=1 Tax=Pontibacter sp. G13 TaxID=3074898 RepID=UPI00288AD214|nr:dihydrolipoamide acetyltransferase family protein [Pontibacter sp. G13]WNJ21153.1 dihydrolipoamide acetyltransferase family protein [Pontibacter sp. G13]
MAKFELTMPKMGESIIEATILSWTKGIGDEIEAEETVLEIATDKVDSEVPSPVEGKLLEKRFNEGDVVPVGEVIAIIETESAGADSAPTNGVPAEVEVAAAEVPYVPAGQPAVATAERVATGEPRFYSPLVLNIAKEESIGMAELETVPGTGRGGRVTKKDILSYVKTRGSQPAAPVAPAAKTKAPAKPAAPKPAAPITYNHSGNIEIVEMDRMRKIIAQNMVQSKHTSAHVTSFVEADVTNVFQWRKKNKDEFQKKYGEKLTFTPIFLQAVAKALVEHPGINVSIDGDNILYKKDINVGIAVALPNDNLIVPVIRNADRLNLAGLAAAVNDLAARARINKLKPAELDGGTYTLSNVGTFGNVMGTPIIMQPQVAILAVGAIRKIPAVIETPSGDMIGIRQKMFLSHSYDHRVVDGALGGRFVKRVADILEAWDLNADV